MTQAIDIHGKARDRERSELLERAVRVLLRDEFARLKASDDHEGRLYTLDLAPTDVQPVRISGPGLYGTTEADVRAADLAAPVRKVRAQFGYLQNLVTSSDLSKLVRPLGGASGAAPVVANPHVANAAYSAKEFAIDVAVPPEVVKNADQDLGEALGLFARATWDLTREYRVAQLLTTAANWNAANVFAGVTWLGGNPISDLYKALAVSRNPRPNLLVLSEKVSQGFFDNADVQRFIQTGGLAHLGIRVVVVGAKSTVAGVPADVWASVGNHAVLVHTRPDNETSSGALSTAATARWDGDAVQGVPKGESWVFLDGVLLRTFWSPRGGARGLESCVLVVNEDVVMIDGTLGALITNVA